MADAASKYEPLTRYLSAQSADVVRMKFAEIERVISAKLPPLAGHNRAYWSNNAANSVLTKAWLAAGFRSEQVDFTTRNLVFRRAAPNRTASGFDQTAATFEKEAQMPSLSVFGCLAGTVVVHCDLTEAAGPTFAGYLDETYGLPA